MGARRLPPGSRLWSLTCAGQRNLLESILGRLEIHLRLQRRRAGRARRFNDEIMGELRAIGIFNPIRSPVKVQGARWDCEV